VSAIAADSAETLLKNLEARRLSALKDRHAATLQSLIADDYIHVHSTGKVDDKAGFIKGTLDRPRRSERGELSIRVYGDLAVITGEQSNQAVNADGSTGTAARFMATQVAHREKNTWRLVSMHVTPITPVANSKPAEASEYANSNPSAGLTADQKAIEALEKRRATAIAEANFDALAGVLADDYLHIYGSGTSSDRAGYIDQVKKAPRVPTRGPLKIRVYGDTAVVTGSLLNRIKYPDRPEALLDTSVTQVARKINGEWKFVSFQITPKVTVNQ
jgi:ketosteroid isomerase-like protein